MCVVLSHILHCSELICNKLFSVCAVSSRVPKQNVDDYSLLFFFFVSRVRQLVARQPSAGPFLLSFFLLACYKLPSFIPPSLPSISTHLLCMPHLTHALRALSSRTGAGSGLHIIARCLSIPEAQDHPRRKTRSGVFKTRP